MLYFICSYLGAVFYALLVSSTSSYPSPCSLLCGTIVLGRGGGVWSACSALLCVRVRRHGAFVLWKLLSSLFQLPVIAD